MRRCIFLCTSRCQSFLLISMFLLLFTSPVARGQEVKASKPSGEISTGTVVVLKLPDLHLEGEGEHRIISAGDGISLSVDRVEGKRVHVTSSDRSRQGWINVDLVVPSDTAMGYFNGVIERTPGPVDALRMRGRLWSDRKDYERALSDLDEAIRLAPDRAPSYVDRGRVRYSGKKDVNGGLADLNKAIQLDPALANAYRSRALMWMQNRDRARMKADLDMAIQLDPADARSSFFRHVYWLQEGNTQKALEDIDRIIKFDPTDAYAYQSRGSIHIQRGEMEKAVADFSDAIRHAPNDAWNYAQRASAWARQHNPVKAIADYTAAIAIDPRNSGYFLSRGYLWSRQADHERAISDFNEAIRLNPRFAGSYVSRGIEWEKDLQLDRAMADYHRAIELDSKSTIAYEGRGRIWKALKRYDKAVDNYADLARVVPDDPTGHRELAWVVATCEQPQILDGRRAVEEASLACKLTNWTDPDCLEALAAAFAESKDFDTAVKWQDRAIEIHRGKGAEGSNSKTEVEMRMRDRLSLYRMGVPYRVRPRGVGNN